MNENQRLASIQIAEQSIMDYVRKVGRCTIMGDNGLFMGGVPDDAKLLYAYHDPASRSFIMVVESEAFPEMHSFECPFVSSCGFLVKQEAEKAEKPT